MAATLGKGNITVTFAGTAITSYLNQAQLEMVVAELESTNFSSSGTESDPGLTTYSISMGGDWSKLLDNLLGAAAMSPTKQAAVITVGSSTNMVTYTWTAAAFVSNYSFNGNNPADKITWSAKLNLSGAPVRS